MDPPSAYAMCDAWQIRLSTAWVCVSVLKRLEHSRAAGHVWKHERDTFLPHPPISGELPAIGAFTRFCNVNRLRKGVLTNARREGLHVQG